ncbi:MAG: AAA family ATPase [Planctomycetota bacterium]|nr:AAA family ATPase [Planctomycetota bacterium]
MKLTNTKDQSLTKIKALVHGDSGIGKTTSLKTLPVDRTIIACRERSMIPLRHDKYDVLNIEKWEDVRTLLGLFVSPDAEHLKPLAGSVKGKDILVIDSLSGVSELCIQHIIQVDRKLLIGERTDGKRKTPENVYEDQMQMEDWGLYRTRMKNMLSAFTQLPIHIVMTALSSWAQDKNGSSVYRTPALNGKLAYECPAYFDLVLHMESTGTGNEETRVWRTFNDGETIAKDASGALDRYEESNWSKLFAKILTGETK